VGDVVQVEIEKTDAYDLIGRVVSIEQRPVPRRVPPISSPVVSAPAEKLTRISTGAALRVIG